MTIIGFDYNKDVETRDKFLYNGYNPENYRIGGICRVNGLTSTEIKYLLDMKFIDPEECQGASPSTMEIYEFLKDHPKFYAFGYAVSPDRSDYRITLEGICSEEYIDRDELIDFVEFARGADEFDLRPCCRAWWD